MSSAKKAQQCNVFKSVNLRLLQAVLDSFNYDGRYSIGGELPAWTDIIGGLAKPMPQKSECVSRTTLFKYGPTSAVLTNISRVGALESSSNSKSKYKTFHVETSIYIARPDNQNETLKVTMMWDREDSGMMAFTYLAEGLQGVKGDVVTQVKRTYYSYEEQVKYPTDYQDRFHKYFYKTIMGYLNDQVTGGKADYINSLYGSALPYLLLAGCFSQRKEVLR